MTLVAMLEELHTMIRRHDDQRVFAQTVSVQRVDQIADLTIGIENLAS